MSLSISDTEKRSGPSAVVEGRFCALRSCRTISALDAWIAAQPEPRPSRPEAIRRMLAEALGKPADAGSIAAEDLNASNDE